MFNNPFDSFHDTVVEAKEERERLDRLLTISTPRERLLVAVIGLSLLALAAWLVFGSIARGVSVEGVLVEPGENRVDGNRSVQALVWVDSDIAPQIEAGMPAVIELTATDGEADTLHGVVAAMAAIPVSDRLAPFESAAPASVHRLDITLDEDSEPAALASGECRIFIELGTQSPIALFILRRS